MNTWLVVAVVVALVAFVARKVRSGDGPTLAVRDLRRAIAELVRQGRDGAFLAVLFGREGRAGEPLALQLSLEHGRLGIDWVLRGDRNLADRARFETFARERGYVAREHELNGVRYLRIEDGDLPGFAEAVLTDLYRLAPDATLYTVVEGFTLAKAA